MQKKEKNLKLNASLLIFNLLLSVLSFTLMISLIIENVNAQSAGEVAKLNELSKLGRQGQTPSDNLPLGNSLPGEATKTSIAETLSGIKDGGALTVQFKDGTILEGTKKIVEGKSFIETQGGVSRALDESAIESVKQPTVQQSTGFFTYLINDAILGSLVWAGVIGGLAYGIATMAGLNNDQSKSIGFATASGVFAFNTAYRLIMAKTLISGKDVYIFGSVLKEGIIGQVAPLAGGFISFGIGIAISLVVLYLTWKNEYKKIITFNCEPWEAPKGGEYCDKCNIDSKNRPCTEYRCKSLGQSCELLNVGTGNETCVWLNRNDVTSPTIDAWYSHITSGYSYKDVQTRPPGHGMKIVRDASSDGCIKAFEPLEFGIVTNEPTQCKIDYNHTATFDEMSFYMGESNIYNYNHSQKLSLPSPDSMNAQSPGLQNDGVYTLYIRCQDANCQGGDCKKTKNGNYNIDEFAVRFCVEKGPDTTPPKIEATSISNNMPIAFNISEVEVEVYVNEPAECKWSRLNQVYGSMENSMSCSTNIWEMNANLYYRCIANLTGIRNDIENKFYFRCKDQPWMTGENEKSRNENTESYEYMLKGTRPLKILSVEPNGTVNGGTTYVPVTLRIETASGYSYGDADCYYSLSSKDEDYIKFFTTGKAIHEQRQDLPAGNYTYYFKCLDLGGNSDKNSSSFTVKVDKAAPSITRAYYETKKLKIVTNEQSNCMYSIQNCNYEFEEGIVMPQYNSTEHFAEWQKDTNFYIKCEDVSGNRPDFGTCNIIVKAYGKDPEDFE